MPLVYASPVNVHCKFVIVVDFRPPRRADVCPGINHAGIEPRDSSRVWFRTREEGRESVGQEAKTSDEVSAEEYREKRREIPAGALGRFMPALAGSLAPRIHSSLSGPGGRTRTWLTGEVSPLPLPHRSSFSRPRGPKDLAGYYTICTES